MPVAQIALLNGSGNDRRRAVTAKVTNAVADGLTLQPVAARVLLQAIEPIDWGAVGTLLADKTPG